VKTFATFVTPGALALGLIIFIIIRHSRSIGTAASVNRRVAGSNPA